LYLFLLYACAAVVTLELYSDSLFVYYLGTCLKWLKTLELDALSWFSTEVIGNHSENKSCSRIGTKYRK